MDQQSFFFQAFIYLSAAVICVPVAKKLGLGSVLGYLIAGVIIGPSVLSLIGKEGQDVMHFAEFGVVMMLFLIGLELEPELLWKLRKSIVGLGGLQVAITSAVIALIALGFGLTWRPAIALGMILSLSSTAIVIQTLTEKGLIRAASGRSSFAVLLFQDISVIPMFAILPLLATYQIVTEPAGTVSNWVSGRPGWLQTLIVSGSVAIIVIAGNYLIRPLLRVIAGTRLREIFTASALLLVVGIAVLMTQVGLSPALGAFLAGVVLANSEYKHELESDIEPFKGLLLGLFFIAVGSSINFGLILANPGRILGLVALLMTVKGLVLFILGKIFKLSTDQNMIFSFSLSQAGEFAFVLFSFCLQGGILDNATANTMIAVVAISMAFTPLVMLINERLLLPRIGTLEELAPEADDINQDCPVIIAGLGHFGSTIGRFLRAHRIYATYLDIDSDRVAVLRKMGMKVFYGDASRAELLASAGAAKARIIVIAIEPAEKRLEMIETIKKHFPNLRMLVRASNRNDAYDQMNAGMLHIYRESIDTSLRLGVDVMTMMGFRKYTAQRAARLFFRYDEANLKKLSSIRDQEEYINTARGFIEEMEQLLQNDRNAGSLEHESDWDIETYSKEVKEEAGQHLN
ncbi:MAG: cation:proton antiporter [Chitinophagaceae bacterium]|nr:cation:proton antiporter [Chitinophagaceae bacterium]